MAPQLEADAGADQVDDHGEEQEDDGGRLSGLRPAEGAAHAVVEHGVGAQAPAGGVAHVDDACAQKKKKRKRQITMLFIESSAGAHLAL